MNPEIKFILAMQLALLQEACTRDMLPEEAARLSETLSYAVCVAAAIQTPEALRN